MNRAANAYQISCTHLNWIIDLCQDKEFHMGRITRTSGRTIENLRNEQHTVTWQEYADILSSLSKFFDNVDIREAGSRTWNLAPFDTYAGIGRVLFNCIDQFMEMYGTMGYLPSNFPIDSQVEQTAPNRLTIRLLMREGANPSFQFYSMVAGQMQTLPQSLGLPAASVTMKPVDRGAVFTIALSGKNLLVTSVQRAWRWFNASRMITREFARLRGAHQKLKTEHAEAIASTTKAKQQIAEHEENYRLLGSNIQNVVWTMDGNLAKGFVTPTVSMILGYSDEKFMSMPWEELLSSEDCTVLRKTTKDVLETGQNYPALLQMRVKHAHGKSIWLEIKILAHHRPNTLICIARDISDAKVIENELASRISNYRLVTDSAMDGIVTFDSENLITYVNPAATDIFGYTATELIGTTIRDIMPEALGDIRLRDLYRTTGELAFSRIALRGLRRNKTLIPLEVSFASHSQENISVRTCIIRDISGRAEVERERESLQTQLEAAQKMDSIGQLSGGIAHDFNNLLVAILGYTDLALQSDNKESVVRHLEEIRKAGERGTDMTQKLLAFSRRQITEPAMIVADDLIAGVHDLLERLLPTSIEISYDNRASGAQLVADITQLEQVLINLAVNARDAMPGGGTLRISLAIGRLESRKEDQLILQVSDTGVGMDQEIQDRIFEPFYTTKPEGKGTGLGLAVVFGIVNQHRGFIQVNSALGEGTTFTLYLPLSTGDAGSITRSSLSTAAGGNETVLLVEDNEQVRDLARLILTGAGYRVLEATDGQQGVDVYRRSADEIDLILMDIVMPVMGGREAASQMLEVRSDARIVFTTGYSPDSVHTRFISEEDLPVIQKPYGTNDLRQQVRDALDGTFRTQPNEAEADDSSVTFG